MELEERVPVSAIQILPVTGIPEVSPGADLAELITAAIKTAGTAVLTGDIFVVAQKVVSKAEGKIVSLDAIQPSAEALLWAGKYGRDARLIELVLRQAKRIVRMERGVIVTETRHGFVCANAGVDASNVPAGTALLLPDDPDGTARRLCEQLSATFALSLGVIISDTFGRPWREGLVNVALGVHGIPALLDYRGHRDSNGNVLSATVIALADELASAAELVMGKTSRTPVAIIRGISFSAAAGTGRELIRSPESDIFR